MVATVRYCFCSVTCTGFVSKTYWGQYILIPSYGEKQSNSLLTQDLTRVENIMNVDLLSNILSCPQCQVKLNASQGILVCPECGRSPDSEDRLLDFRNMTPKLPLHFAKYTQRLHEAAGEVMADVPTDWRVQNVLDMVRESGPGQTCLEIGGADGPMTKTLESLYSSVLSIDFGMSYLKRIRAKTTKAICLCGDAHFLPLLNQSVDFVVCSEVLEHVTIPSQLLLEIRRVLKKNGRCLLSVPNEAAMKLWEFGNKTEMLPARDSHISFYNSKTLRNTLFRMGFQIVKFRYLSRPAKTKWSPRSLAGALQRKLNPTYLLCLAEVMDKPDRYWDSLEEIISSEKLDSIFTES